MRQKLAGKKSDKKSATKLSTRVSDFDAHLMAEGTHERAYRQLGAHLSSAGDGVSFAVWAPNATAVHVVGEFNDWDAGRHAMLPSDSGIWTLFVPGVGEHAVYKYNIQAANGATFDKADPFGFAMEERPRTGSVVTNLDNYQWQDETWIQQRGSRQAFDRPISVYEVHLGSWRKADDDEWGLRYLTYRELAEQLIPYVLDMGYTHIEMLPIMEHPLDASWGYQVLGFFAPTSRFGTPQDFMYFIDQCHQHGLGVLLDWVPAHFPKDGAGLNYFDGTHLYSHADPRQGEHQDWGTLIFNYSRNEVRSFLLSNAVFWMDKYHFDGVRVDAVASMLYLDYSREPGEWLPNEYGGRENIAAITFLRKMNEVLHGLFPGVLTIAEESTSWPMVTQPPSTGGLGFSFKWNMGWMHDTLRFMARDAVHRQYHQNDLTFSLLYAFSENFVLPISHDEVVHGKGSLINKMVGDEWQKFAGLRAYLAFMWAHPGKKLLFMGCDFGQWQEWNFEKGLEWDALRAPNHQGVQRLVKDLNQLLRDQPALHEVDFDPSGFTWVDASDTANSVLTWTRHAHQHDDLVLAVFNFTPVPRYNYRIGVPQSGFYQELVNTDARLYGGSDAGNGGGCHTEEVPWHGHPQSLQLTLPPLAALMLKPGHNA